MRLHRPPAKTKNIVLVDQSEVVSRTGCCLFECVAHQALHAKGRVDGDLLRDLVNRALTQGSTVTGVQAFGALAHDDESISPGLASGVGTPG